MLKIPYYPAAALVSFASARLSGQAIPRTADGRPDFAGIWTNSTLTPFERPKEFAGKEFFTPREATDYGRRMQEQNNRDRRGATPQDDVNLAYNEAWFDRGTKVYSNLRTSIVVDPADGRVPALTPEARDAAAARAAVQSRWPEGPETESIDDMLGPESDRDPVPAAQIASEGSFGEVGQKKLRPRHLRTSGSGSRAEIESRLARKVFRTFPPRFSGISFERDSTGNAHLNGRSGQPL
jgi:hypothetical protein